MCRRLLFFIVCLWVLPQFVSAAPVVTYITDPEGAWIRLANAVSRSSHVTIDDEGELQFLDDDSLFVFGGDAVDQGPDSMKIVEALVSFKRRHFNRVALLLGNRDINKLRILLEINEARRMNYPVVQALKIMFEKTMGAAKAFEYRRGELARRFRQDLKNVSDEVVAASFEEELKYDKPFRKFLEWGEMGLIIGETLFVHGAITEENFCLVPLDPVSEAYGATKFCEVGDIRTMISRLNSWKNRQLIDWKSAVDYPKFLNAVFQGLNINGARDLIKYQEPRPGKQPNQGSVIYGRFSFPESSNQPVLPPEWVMRRLKISGINRVVAGHTPYDSMPLRLKEPQTGMEIILADISDPHDATLLTLNGNKIELSTAASVQGGLNFEDSRVGLKTEEGFLVQAVYGNGDLRLFKVGEKYKPEVKIIPKEKAAELSLQRPSHPKDCLSLIGKL